LITLFFHLQNPIFAPSWSPNAHRIVYFTGGRGRVQVATPLGKNAVDKEVKEGDLLVVPKQFPATKLAARDSPLEWVSIQTSAHPTAYFLAGANSVFKSFPFELLVAGRTRDDYVSIILAVIYSSRAPLDICLCFDVYSGSISVLRMRRGKLASFSERTSRRDDDGLENRGHLAGGKEDPPQVKVVLKTYAVNWSLSSFIGKHECRK
jgi:hypothetical protein